MQEAFIKIYGDVQGVGFRYQSRQLAATQKLTGWAKNAEDGTVEILVQGKRRALDQFLSWVKIGPRFATIEKLEIKRQKSKETFATFEIRY